MRPYPQPSITRYEPLLLVKRLVDLEGVAVGAEREVFKFEF